MMPVLMLRTKHLSFKIKYKTKEEFYYIRNLLKRMGAIRSTFSGTRYPNGGVFIVNCCSSYLDLTPKLTYDCSGSYLLKYAKHSENDILNIL